MQTTQASFSINVEDLEKYANYASVIFDRCEWFGENMQTVQVSFAVEFLGHMYIRVYQKNTFSK